MKGAELPINTLIIIVIAVTVLIIIISLIFGIWKPSASGLDRESAKNNACQKLMSMSCLPQTNAISISEFDADNDGITGGDEVNPLTSGTLTGNCADANTAAAGDNLFMLCKCHYSLSGANLESDCKKICGCST